MRDGGEWRVGVSIGRESGRDFCGTAMVCILVAAVVAQLYTHNKMTEKDRTTHTAMEGENYPSAEKCKGNLIYKYLGAIHRKWRAGGIYPKPLDVLVLPFEQRLEEGGGGAVNPIEI